MTVPNFYSLPWQSGTVPFTSVLDSMLDLLPDAYFRPRGGPTWEVLHSEAGELHAARGTMATTIMQILPDMATWEIPDWENLVGIPSDEEDDIVHRRNQVILKIRGLRGPVGPYLISLASLALRQGGSVDLLVTPGRRVVYRSTADGWPGDDLFTSTEYRLVRAGPCYLGHYVACGNTQGGLTVHQTSMMRVAAVSSLTVQQISGV